MLFYRAGLDLSPTTLNFVTNAIRDHRAGIGSRWRRLTCRDQALLVLAHLRNGDTYHRLAAGFGIGVATVCRYIHETVDLLSRLAPSLLEAVEQLAGSGSNYALLDGTVIRIDRVHHQKPYYCMKTRHHGITLQALTDPHGRLVWISDGLPGSVYDLTAARQHGILHLAFHSGLILLADRGYIGAGQDVLVPYRSYQRALAPSYKDANQAHAALRCRVEHAFATLKNWRVLTRVRAGTDRVTHYARAILTLQRHTR
jgi:DDE superfamily endonuclease/Helix-turn-helix of DDE superfamily endonuclease